MKQDISLKPVLNIESDAKLLMSWRNDPETLKASFHGTTHTWPKYFTSFQKYFIKDVLRPFFITFNDKPVGFIGFIVYEDDKFKTPSLGLDINVEPSSRGKGIASIALQLLVERLKSSHLKTLIAEVKIDNIVSQKLFVKNGFMYVDTIEKHVADINKDFKIHRYKRVLNEENS